MHANDLACLPIHMLPAEYPKISASSYSSQHHRTRIHPTCHTTPASATAKTYRSIRRGDSRRGCHLHPPRPLFQKPFGFGPTPPSGISTSTSHHISPSVQACIRVESQSTRPTRSYRLDLRLFTLECSPNRQLIAMASSSSAGLTQGQVSELQLAGDYSIKSEAVTPKLGE